ncbi:MAG: hypothetical protein OEP95_10690 [Myxococcales bacterium]|nr:hypothetical protein [Myxococcales bacterium]
MSRRILLVAGLAAVVLAGLGYWFLGSLDARIARVIEHVGSELTGTAVRVGSVDLDLSEGAGTVRNLRVASPDGFSSEPALAFGEIGLDLDVASLRGSPVVLSEVRLLAPRVRLEVDEAGRSNIGELLTRLADDSGEPAAPEGDAVLRFRVERFRFEEGRIDGDASALGGEERALALPPYRVGRLGGERGSTPAELGRTLLVRYLGHVTATAVQDAAFRYLEGKAEELGDRVGDAAKGFLRALRGDSEPAPETD